MAERSRLRERREVRVVERASKGRTGPAREARHCGREEVERVVRVRDGGSTTLVL